MKRVLLGILLLTMLFGQIFAGGNQQSSGTDTAQRTVLRVVDWSDSTKIQRDAFHVEFMKRHPNVVVEYTMLTIDQFRNTVLTAIQSGSGPDLFPVPVGMRLALPVSEKWYVPMDNYITKEFLATIEPNLLREGYQKIDGKLYVLPDWAPLPSPFIFYNRDILAEAGLDPARIRTYDDFRDA